MPETVSWEQGGNAKQFAVTLSPHRGGGLPLQLTVEVWERICDSKEGACDGHSRSLPTSSGQGSIRKTIGNRTENITDREQRGRSIRRVGSATVGPDTLVLSLPGRLSLPLEISPTNSKATDRDGAKATGDGISPGASATSPSGDRADTACQRAAQPDESDGLPPRILLRITPQVGRHWGRRVMMAAGAAKPLIEHRPALGSSLSVISTHATTDTTTSVAASPNESNCLAHVVYMTNAQGSARTWRAPVTPGNSIPKKDFEEVMELVFGSVPACCPHAPTLLVAPVSDIGVQVGKVWIGPKIATRHAIVAHRPQHHHSNPKDADKLKNNRTRNDKGGHITSSDDDDSSADVEPPQEDELFARVVAAEAESLLREIRARDMRTEQRRTTLGRVREICQAWTQARERRANPQQHTGNRASNLQEERDRRRQDLPLRVEQDGAFDGNARNSEGGGRREEHDHDSEKHGNKAEEIDEDSDEDEHLDGREYGDLYRGVLRALEIALPGVSIYLGLVESGGQIIRYVACTRQSTMAGKELKQGEGISFSCVGPRYAPYVVYPPQAGRRPKGGHSTSSRSDFGQKRPPHDQEDDRASFDVLPSACHAKPTKTNMVETTTSRDIPMSSRHQTPQAERSLEQGVVYIQKVFRGKLVRDRLKRGQHSAGPGNVKSTKQARKRNISRNKKPASLIPKVFDYEGRVGWPFVCIPLEGVLRSSSIGVIGLDTFEQMGTSGAGRDQPEAGVLHMLTEAAR